VPKRITEGLVGVDCKGTGQ